MHLPAAGSRPSEVIVEVDRSGKQALLDVLVRYKLRRPLKIEDVSVEWRVWAAFLPESGGGASASSNLLPQATPDLPSSSQGVCFESAAPDASDVFSPSNSSLTPPYIIMFTRIWISIIVQFYYVDICFHHERCSWIMAP